MHKLIVMSCENQSNFGHLQQLHQLTISFGKQQKATMYAYGINPTIDPVIEAYLEDDHDHNNHSSQSIVSRANVSFAVTNTLLLTFVAK